MERARRVLRPAALRRILLERRSRVPVPRPLLGGSPVLLNPAGLPAFFTRARSISVEALRPSDTFPQRHNSLNPSEQTIMAQECGFPSLDALIDATVPRGIRTPPLKLSKFDSALTESQMIEHMKRLAALNKVFKTYIGMGYYNTFIPAVILRNLMENPGWYTQYTPYQAEIAQGRLESLLNYQTMVTDLTGMNVLKV